MATELDRLQQEVDNANRAVKNAEDRVAASTPDQMYQARADLAAAQERARIARDALAAGSIAAYTGTERPPSGPAVTPGHRAALGAAIQDLQTQIGHVSNLRQYHTEGKPVSRDQLDALRNKLDAVSQQLSDLSRSLG